MEQRAFFVRVVAALEAAKVAYAITGSWASITYGTPRTIHALDVVISLTVAQAREVAAALPPPIYKDALDLNYLRRWAAQLAVTDLLDRIMHA